MSEGGGGGGGGGGPGGRGRGGRGRGGRGRGGVGCGGSQLQLLKLSIMHLISFFSYYMNFSGLSSNEFHTIHSLNCILDTFFDI